MGNSRTATHVSWPCPRREYCNQHTIKEFVIPDIMTYDDPYRESSGGVILQRRIFEVKTMRIDSLMNK